MRKILSSCLLFLLASPILFAGNTITYTANEKADLNLNAFNVSVSSHSFTGNEGTIVFDGELTTIGKEAFYETEIMSVAIPVGVEIIDTCAFYRCYDLTSVSLPYTIRKIGYMAFANCSKLSSITLPSNVTEIEEYAFSDVLNIIYDGSATGAPWGAAAVNGYFDGYVLYSDATKTKICGCDRSAKGEIILPNTVTEIKDNAFEGCMGITSINIPESVTKIGEYAFSTCCGLTSIVIPNTVTEIGEYAFIYVNNIVYSGSVSTRLLGAKCINGYVEGNFVYRNAKKKELCGCSAATEGKVVIPESVTSLGNNAFMYCSGITSVSIPNSIMSISQMAFYGCTGLTSITLPSNIQQLAEYAFFGCSLETVYCYSTTPPKMGGTSFDVDDKTNKYDITLYVPYESKTAYETAEFYWMYFKKIKCLGAEETAATEVTVEAEETEAVITWPKNEKAASYTIEIFKNEALCNTLTFDADGILLASTAKAPALDGTNSMTQAQQVNEKTGFQFVVIGLSAGTNYTYTITIKDNSETLIDTFNGTFKTSGVSSATDNIRAKEPASKVIRDGQVFIVRDGKIYSICGSLID